MLESISEWKKLGHVLNVDPKKLLQLSQCGKDLDYCRDQVVSEWLKTDKGASWEKLCKALKQIGSEAEADKIRDQCTLYGECAVINGANVWTIIHFSKVIVL